jgi:very-short-patch-repair endonuclease
MSDFERELYDRISAVEEVDAIPQWPSRAKFIDLVVTDFQGRRLAVEADGDQHHETERGELIPEDIERQGLLEEAGWIFHRIKHSDFKEDPDGEIDRLLEHLNEQPANADLAARMRGEALLPYAVSVAETQAPAQASLVLDATVVESATPREERSDPTQESDAAAMTPREMEQLLDDVFLDPEELEKPRSAEKGAETRRTADELPTDKDAVTTSQSEGTFADVPLRMVALRVAALVAHEEGVAEDELIDKFSSHYRIDVPGNLKKLLEKFAWSAKGHKFIQRDEIRGWVPGDVEAHEIEPFGDWTFNAAVERAAELLRGIPEKQVYEQMLGEVYPTPSGRVPRLVTTVVGKAIYVAKNQ